MRRLFAGWTGMFKVVIALLLLIVGAAAVHAQKGISDNPFAPTGNPFSLIASRLDGMSSQLDGLIKNVTTLIPRPDADGRTRLYTGYVTFLNEDDHARCLLANLSDGTMHNVITRVVDFSGTVRFSASSDMEVPVSGPLVPGKGTGYGFAVERFRSVRCEFVFDGRPEDVRATIAIDGGAILEAR